MWVVLVILKSERSSLVGTASTTADGAGAGEAGGAFEVARLPFVACVWVSRYMLAQWNSM